MPVEQFDVRPADFFTVRRFYLKYCVDADTLPLRQYERQLVQGLAFFTPVDEKGNRLQELHCFMHAWHPNQLGFKSYEEIEDFVKKQFDGVRFRVLKC